MKWFVLPLLALTMLAATNVARSADAPPKSITPDLKAIAWGKGANVPAGMSIKWVEDAKGRPALRMQPSKKDVAGQVVTLTGVEFTDGEIEFDALGQSDPPQSNFLGVAFRFVDQKTYDAVYLRPFNFRADDADRRSHAVQYISQPDHPWEVLRKEKPGQYEKPIVPAPDGDGWVHVRIVVQRPKVSVYINEAKEPSLVVEELTARTGGGIGLWVGPGQGGHFSSLKITPAK